MPRVTRLLNLPSLLAGLLLAGVLSAQQPAGTASRPADRLVVHEWGTFTSLQDERGRTIRGINTDDEPVPRFVHGLADRLIIPPSELAPVYYKGVPRVHPDVVMRLETPVIYFYLPDQAKAPLTVDVRVQFRGGWLTEYYPNARVDVPGLVEDEFRFGRIAPDTVGTLDWTGLQVGGNSGIAFPETDAHVWLAPRQTAADPVATPAGEAEKYLFYRGVGHLEAPLRVSRDEKREQLTISNHFAPEVFATNPQSIRTTTLWLVDIRQDGAVAYRSLGEHRLSGGPGSVVTETSSRFEPQDYSPDNLARLRGTMREALITDGLYADEAAALLSTWEHGYFRSAGTRLFFLLPQAWTDAVLPLELSVPAEVRRTMVGRIELVTPRHRQLLRQVAAHPERIDVSWLYQSFPQDEASRQVMRAVWEGKTGLQNAAVTPPDYYQSYIELGRFRGALLLDAATRSETARSEAAKWAAFAGAYGLSYYAAPSE